MAASAEVADRSDARVRTRTACHRSEPADDATLIGAARAGDLAAYGELYGRHVDACRRLARRLCRSRHVADDVVSDVFANTLNAIRNGHGPVDEFAPYVLRSIRHQAGRAHSRGEGRRTDSVDPATFDVLTAAESTGGDDQLLMTQAFGRLPDRFRHVLWDTEVEGRSHAEIGARLGLRETAVAALAHRARNAFCRAYLDVRANRTTCRPDCREVRSLLASHVRGSVGTRSGGRIDTHLATCDECRSVFADMERLDVSLRTVLWPASGAGLIGVSRWAALAERASWLAGIGDLSKLVATAAVGLTVVAGPVVHDELTARVDPADVHAVRDHSLVTMDVATAAAGAITSPADPASSPTVEPAAAPDPPAPAPPIVGPTLEDDLVVGAAAGDADPSIDPDADGDADPDGPAIADLDAGDLSSVETAHSGGTPDHSVDGPTGTPPEPGGADADAPLIDLGVGGDDGLSVELLGDDLLAVGLDDDEVLSVNLLDDELLAVDVASGDLASVDVGGSDGLVAASVADDAVTANVAGPSTLLDVGVTDAVDVRVLTPDGVLTGSLLGIELGGLLGS